MIGLAGTFSISGCAPSNDDSNSEDRIIQMLDERRYDDVIEMIENDPDPEVKKTYSTYLVQAYLGVAHLEPLSFSNKVLARQSSSTEQDVSPVDRMIPDCDPSAMSERDEIDFRCTLWRIFRNLTRKNFSQLERASLVAQKYFDKDTESTNSINFIGAYVETLLTLHLIKETILYYDQLDPIADSDQDISALFRLIGDTTQSAERALSRAKHVSQIKITQSISGFQDENLFTDKNKNWSDQIDFRNESGIPLIRSIAYSTSQDMETIAGKVLIIRELDRFIIELSGADQKDR